jgi:hypothetical protein
MVSPLVAWSVTLIAIVVTGLLWVVSAPIVSALYAATESGLTEEAQGAANTLRLQFITIPVILDVGLVLWAFLVTTRRQVVTTPRYG